MNKLEIKWSYAEGSFDLDTAQMVCIPQKDGIADLCLQDGMNFTLAEIQTGLPESNSKFGYEIEKRFNAYHQNEKRIAEIEAENKRLRELVDKSWTAGYELCSKAYAGDHFGLVTTKQDFMREHGLGE